MATFTPTDGSRLVNHGGLRALVRDVLFVGSCIRCGKWTSSRVAVESEPGSEVFRVLCCGGRVKAVDHAQGRQVVSQASLL